MTNAKQIWWLVGLLLTSTLAAPAQERSSGYILLDVSGSMADNDPQNLRWDGLLTLVQLLGLSQANSLGVRYFTHQDVLKLRLQRVSAQTYADFKRVAAERPSAGGTDLVPGLRNAVEELSNAPGVRYVVIVSDGFFERPGEVADLAIRFQQRAGKIFFVCLGRHGTNDSKVNSSIVPACTQTGGKEYEIRSVDKRKVLEVFLDIFVRISPPTLGLLADEQGRFALHSSHRSFIALDPMGQLLQVRGPSGIPISDGQGAPFRASNVMLPAKQWNVVVCERPTLPNIAGMWDSTQWQLTGQLGQPLPHARAYIHGDISFKDIPSEGYTASAGSSRRMEVGVVAGSLSEWSSEREAELMKHLIVRAEVVDAISNQTVTSGRLLPSRNGSFAGEVSVPPKTKLGQHAILFQLEDTRGNRLIARQDRVPFRITPAYADDPEIVVRPPCEAPEVVVQFPATGAQVTPVFSGGHAKYRLKLRPTNLIPAGASGRPAIHSVRLALKSPRGTELARDLVASEDSVFQTKEWIPLDQPGIYEGNVQVLGTVTIEERDALVPGNKAIRQIQINDTFATRPLRVHARELVLEWDPAPASFGCDQLVYFSGRVRIEDQPECASRLTQALRGGGLSFGIVGAGTNFGSAQHIQLFEKLAVIPEPGGATFSGWFTGARTPDTYGLRAYVTVGGTKPDAIGLPLTLTVGRNLLELAVSAADIPVAASSCGAASSAAVWDNQELTVELRPPTYGTAAAAYEKDPRVDVVASGETRNLPGERTGLRWIARPFTLPVGAHELRAEASLGPGVLVRHHLRLGVREKIDPKLTIEWQSPNLFRADERVRWAGRVRIQAEPTAVPDIQRALLAGSLAFQVQRGGEMYHSRTNADVFELSLEPHEAAVAFQGTFLGAPAVGQHTVRVVLAQSGTPVELVNPEHMVAVGGNLVNVVGSTRRGERSRLVLTTTNGPMTQPNPVFADQSLAIDLVPSEALLRSGLSRYLLAPEVQFVSPGNRVPLELETNQLHASFKPVRLQPGQYEVLVRVRVAEKTEVTHRGIVAISSVPTPQVGWHATPKSTLLQYEETPLEATITFNAGDHYDWTEWIHGARLLASLQVPNARRAPPPLHFPITGELSNGFLCQTNFHARWPGEAQLRLQLMRDESAASPPLEHNCHIESVLSFEVYQSEKKVLDSRRGETSPLKLDQALRIIGGGDDPKWRLSSIEVLLTRDGSPLINNEDLLRPDGSFERNLSAADVKPGKYACSFVARVVSGTNDSVVLRNSFTPMDCERNYWFIVLKGLGILAVPALLLWWFWPALVAGQGRFPRLEGALQRFYPRPGPPEPLLVFGGSRSFLLWLRHRGVPPQRIRIGKGGNYELEKDGDTLGLSEAYIELAIVPGNPAKYLDELAEEPILTVRCVNQRPTPVEVKKFLNTIANSNNTDATRIPIERVRVDQTPPWNVQIPGRLIMELSLPFLQRKPTDTLTEIPLHESTVQSPIQPAPRA